MNKAFVRIYSLLFFHLYIFVRFTGYKYLASINQYSTYLFEVCFVGICIYIFRKKVNFKVTFDKGVAISSMGAFIFGILIVALSKFFNLTIPFTINSSETIFFLLVVAPILEEFLYRFSIWHLLNNFSSKIIFILISTASLFAYAHFHPYSTSPSIFKSFIVFQTIYAVIIGFWFGYIYHKTKSLSYIILLHFLLNLGFLFGLKI